MKWADVNYQLNGFQCKVVYDTKDSRPTSYQGYIHCPEPGSIAILRNISDTRFTWPPDYAVVYELKSPTPAQNF